MNTTVIKPEVTLDTLFAAAAAAYRNPSTQIAKWGDKAKEFLLNQEQIQDEDRELGARVIEHFRGYVLLQLAGNLGLGVGKSLFELVTDTDNVIKNNRSGLWGYIGLVAYGIKHYHEDIAKQTLRDRIRYATGGFVGEPGSKFEGVVEVIGNNFSHKFKVNFVTAVTEADQIVFFSCNRELLVGSKVKIRATVKQHREDKTQLNRVKFLDYTPS